MVLCPARSVPAELLRNRQLASSSHYRGETGASFGNSCYGSGSFRGAYRRVDLALVRNRMARQLCRSRFHPASGCRRGCRWVREGLMRGGARPGGRPAAEVARGVTAIWDVLATDMQTAWLRPTRGDSTSPTLRLGFVTIRPRFGLCGQSSARTTSRPRSSINGFTSGLCAISGGWRRPSQKTDCGSVAGQSMSGRSTPIARC